VKVIGREVSNLVRSLWMTAARKYNGKGAQRVDRSIYVSIRDDTRPVYMGVLIGLEP
jgi:hypothetical protein